MKGVVAAMTAMAFTIMNFAYAQDIQVTLGTEKNTFSLNERIELFYEVLWLGQTDGEIYFNTVAFPELQVSYLNMLPVEMTVLENFALSSEPSRHERRVWAPTMSGRSDSFAVNAKEGTRFLNGKLGYYDLSRTGTYVIRAIFRKSPNWPLYKDQIADVTSNALVIEVVE